MGEAYIKGMVTCGSDGSYKGSKFLHSSWRGEAHQMGCPKIVLDHVHVYLYMFVRTTTLIVLEVHELGTH